MSGMCLAYITCTTQEDATALAHALVTQKLAACVNIFPTVTSVYLWQGALEQSKEVVIIAKTSISSWDALQAFVEREHSYDCPCIVRIPVEGGYPPFLQWVQEQTHIGSSAKVFL